MDGSISERRATPADIDVVAGIVALAFTDDPLWGHALRSLDATGRLPFWRLFAEGALRYSWTWLAEGGAATSLWIPPGGSEFSPEQEDRLFELARGLGAEEGNFHEMAKQFDAAHPHAEPHYYLSLLGTHPDHRGRGVGMRLLAHNLEMIDADHAAAYLESSNPANNRRYAGVGFAPIGEFSYPQGGPLITTMWRPAR